MSDSGTPSYSQGIAVPPGVAGMAPKLGLLYAGGGVNGPVGHGWSVQGLSSITRCPATIATDGKRAGVSFNANDKLCLDGQRLIQTDASGVPQTFPQSNDAKGVASGSYREYRTEKDTYSRVRAYGYANGDTSGAQGPAYFKVWTKAGQVYEYGASPGTEAFNAMVTTSQSNAVMAWGVSRISDTLGNHVDFRYDWSTTPWGSATNGSIYPGREWNIVEIQYSGNKVVFAYDDRTTLSIADAAETYNLGSKNLSTKRLKAITTYVNAPNTTPGALSGAVAVKTVKLSYDNGPVTKRSRLKSVQECAGDANSSRCLPATTFAYAAGGSDAYQPHASFNMGSAVLHDVYDVYGVLVGDFNGDGKSDFLRWGPAVDNALFLSNGDGTFSGQSVITDKALFSSDSCVNTIVADVNGDGLPDLVRFVSPTSRTGEACGPESNYVYFSNGQGGFTRATISGPTLERAISKATGSGIDCHVSESGDCPEAYMTAGANFFLLDINGDGKLDVITTKLPSYVLGTTADPCGSQICTRVWLGNGNGTFIEQTTNLAHTSVYVEPKPGVGPDVGAPANIADIDGDGILDLIAINTAHFNKSPVFRSSGDGNFTPASTGQTCDYPIDFNGDGRSDCLVPNASVASNRLQLSIGTGALPNATNFNLTQAGQELTGIGRGITVTDVNGDGRQDIIRWADDATKNAVFLSNGDGTFTASGTFNLNTSTTRLRSSDNTFSFALGDFTGRGNIEILRLGPNGSNVLYVKTDATPPDQLISVTSGSGAVTQLYYVPISNSTPSNGVSASVARYTGDRGTANAATGSKVDLTFPIYVVATQRSSNGVGGTVSTEYAYAGLKADVQGRGLLGFRQATRQSTGPNGSPLTVVTQYHQTHPYIGVATRTETYAAAFNAMSASNLLSRTVNIYCDQTAASGTENSATETAPCNTTSKIQRPYVRKTTEEGWDLQGATLPTVTTVNTFNGSGDPTQIIVTTTGNVPGLSGSTLQTTTKTTTNTYLVDNTSGDNWVLGRLSRATVQNTVPNSLASTDTWGGGAPYSTATNGNPLPPPAVILSPALILQILSDD